MPWFKKASLAALLLCLPRDAGAATDESSHWASDPKTHCTLFDATLRPGDTVNWIGDCRNGRGEGPGTASFFNSGAEYESFTGNFSGGMAQDGHVIVRWGHGWSYEGNMKSGRFDGQGVLINDKNERFEGSWKDGKLNGTGSVTHDSGERYDGEWKNDLPNGHGILIHADGSRLEGEFVDGNFAGTASASPVSLDGKGAITEAVGPPAAPINALAQLSGKTLLAVDGAALNLTPIEGGIERDITAANGVLEKTTFTFINERLGTVAADEGTAAANVTGFFRLTDNGVEVRYADGRGETLSANDDGVLLRLETPGTAAACRSFYPEGHSFSDAEKKAAVAEYANRLGLAAPVDVKSGCTGDVAQSVSPATKPERQADAKRPAKFAAATRDKIGALEPVTVRNSVVHAIDAMPIPILPMPGVNTADIASNRKDSK